MEKHKSLAIDPFVVTALLVLVSAAYTFYDLFLTRNFPVFTTEEEIEESIQSEFPLFVDYL